MKTTSQIKIRSQFTAGLNLGGAVHKTKRGKGSYQRMGKYGNRWD